MAGTLPNFSHLGFELQPQIKSLVPEADPLWAEMLKMGKRPSINSLSHLNPQINELSRQVYLSKPYYIDKRPTFLNDLSEDKFFPLPLSIP